MIHNSRASSKGVLKILVRINAIIGSNIKLAKRPTKKSFGCLNTLRKIFNR